MSRTRSVTTTSSTPGISIHSYYSNNLKFLNRSFVTHSSQNNLSSHLDNDIRSSIVEVGVSPSGNRLLQVTIPDDSSVEWDNGESRALANSVNERNLRDLVELDFVPQTTTAHKKLENRGSGGIYLLLVIVILLLAICIFFTFENVLYVKSPSDWIEPKRQNSMVDGGNDWTFGTDAQRPILDAVIDPLVENNIADWAFDTRRVVSPSATMDGFGSVSLSKMAQFRDVPLFLGLPYTGGDVFEVMLGQCLNLVLANDEGTSNGYGDESHLKVVILMGRKYVNVDTTTSRGIERAVALGLGSSGMVDVVYSPLLYEVSKLFSPLHQARLFLVMRHPVEAQFARFRQWRNTGVIDTEDKIRKMSYDDFAKSQFVGDNWMTRTLVNKRGGEELTTRDVQTAKEFLRRKAIMGLYSDPLGSIKKFARYFNWDNNRNNGFLSSTTVRCFQLAIQQNIEKEEVNSTAFNLNKEDTEEGSEAWDAIMQRNRFDYELYLYAQILYKYQINLS